ncbi:MAG: hypothetical protein ABJF10_17340 [Chthoniobacter sp.]|uniref:hypothetical protein n=1 Tax=Chthoniobacter sp. TaxID=2510640 RepID=UPI0032AC7425
MNIPRILLFLLPIVVTARAQVTDNGTPPAATPPAQTEVQKWIATTDAQWQPAFQRDVTDVYETELGKVTAKYLTSLDTAISRASGASDLDGALALRNERKRFSDTKAFPDADEAAETASVKQIRAVFRPQLARLEKERATRAKALHTKFDQVLAQAQAQLTQQQRLDDALLVKKKREEVAAAWLAASPAAPPAAVVAGQSTPHVPGSGAKVASPFSPAPAAPATENQLAKRLANTKWEYRVKPNDPTPNTIVTIHADATVSWSDRPSLHVAYTPLDERSIQVRDHIWKFSADLRSFTIHADKNAPADRYGTRIKEVK